MAMIWAWAIEMYLSGSWVDITRDVIKTSDISIKGGIQGSSITDCVADVGSLAFVLDNSEANSGHKLGYYAPGHANCRTGFAKGARVRIKFTTEAATKYYLHGRVQTIEPTIGQFRERITAVHATDFMQVLVENKTTRLEIQQNKRYDQLIETLINNAPIAPLATNYAVDPSSAEMAFHLERDEATALMNVAQKICQSTMGRLYLRGDATGGETLVYESRYTRALASLAGTLDNTMTDMDITYNSDSMYGAVKASIYPYSVDTDVTGNLAQLGSEIAVDAGKSVTVELRLRDPIGNTRVSGFDFVDPLDSATDYRVSATPLSDADDMNSQISISLEIGSNTVMATITNNGVVKAYVNFLQVRCRGIYSYDVVDFNYGTGNRTLNYAMPYQSNANLGRSIGQAIYNEASTDVPTVQAVTFYADTDAYTLGWLMNLDIGSRIALVEEATGLNDEFFINGYEIVIEDGVKIKVTWILTYANVGANFFILDDATQGVLDNTTYLLAI